MNTRPSRTLRAALALHDRPRYALAAEVGLDPTVLSKLLHGAVPVTSRNADKLKAIAAKVGVDERQVFEPATSSARPVAALTQ